MKIPDSKQQLKRLYERGWLLIAIGIMVLIAGGTFVGVVVTHAKQWLHDVPPTYMTNVCNVWSRDHWITITNITTNYPPHAMVGELSPPKFTMEYGIEADLSPWIEAGTPYDQTRSGEITRIIANWVSEDAGVYECEFTTLGYSYFYHADQDGDELVLLDGPHAVVIETSKDMMNWNPVFTNSWVGTNTVELFTDTNATAPAAFYRIRR